MSDFGLKYFLPPPSGRLIVQAYSKAAIADNNSWYVLFSAGVPLKSALVIRRVSALAFFQAAQVTESVMAKIRVSLLIHDGEPAVDGNMKLTSGAFRESARLIWPVPFTRNNNYERGEPNYQPYQGPLVVGGDDNRYAVVALWTDVHASVFGRAGANVDAWYIGDEENGWRGNL